MLAHATTFALDGLGTRRVRVEVDIRPGLPAFTIVGLGDTAVRESRERVRAAILNAGLEFPQRRITANLAPADLRKVGPGFDLALACGILAASGQIPPEALRGRAFYAELSLGGEVRRCRGTLAVSEATSAMGLAQLVVARQTAREAELVPGIEAVGVASLGETVEVMRGGDVPELPPPVEPVESPDDRNEELSDVLGQHEAAEALVVAAAGGHNFLMTGPPGTGKTMLARRLPGILPPLTPPEALEVTRIQSIAGLHAGESMVSTRPFRAPHHTISAAGLVGGGRTPKPGEVTLAHRGVLFLDELSEFARPSLEALRQPLEDGTVSVVRGQRSAVFPARCMVVAATNPCPCGKGADGCRCKPPDLQRHARRLSGPLLDRLDLMCAVPVPAGDLAAKRVPTSADARARVLAAREIQTKRLAGSRASCNAELAGLELHASAPLERAALQRLDAACARSEISLRGRDRIRRVARTIADLDGSARITARHVSSAISYRQDVLRPAEDA